MNVLSLFDGISCGRLALERSGLSIDRYYSSEINEYAIRIAKKNWPETIHLGPVQEVSGEVLPQIDLLIGGSPCQGFSFAGKRLNFDDPRSKLFFEFTRILRECNPRFFMLENVKMKQDCRDIISKYLGVEPIEINSALVSAQNRKRLYWTNIPNVSQPKDKGILLIDVVFSNSMSNFTLSEKAIAYMNREVSGGRTHWDFKHHSDTENPKSAAVVANFFKGVPYNVLKHNGLIRHFYPVECERLQTLPDGYTDGVSNAQRYKAIGNGWTVDVVAHILKHISHM